MDEKTTPETAPEEISSEPAPVERPEPDTNSEALVKAGALFERAEQGLAEALEAAHALGTHNEYASLRGTLRTALEILRNGRPGGH